MHIVFSKVRIFLYLCSMKSIIYGGTIAAACVALSPAQARDFRLEKEQSFSVSIDTAVAPVVGAAFRIVAGDVRNVLRADVSIGSDGLIQTKIEQTGHTQGFRLSVSADGRLHVTGNDPHGLAYGLLEVSRLIGVSPWEWWADASPRQLKSFRLKAGYTDEQWPHVEYRGIFINDEDWGMKVWGNRLHDGVMEQSENTVNGSTTYSGKRGVVGPEANARIFELLLRLRANYFWPAMHECTQPFFLTPGNREAARRYGIFIGGSHCEPMACSTAVEWGMRGKGDYNYATNRENVRRFWQERLDEVKDQDILYTIGMRGVHDSGMMGAKTPEEKKALLQQVINDQREMLKKAHSSRAKAEDSIPPQVFIPYKEVQDIYNAGLRVPDDVCLMWCDDNYGYIRHYPTPEERARSGGNGIYYHVSYWGAPMDYLWLATFSPRLLQMQMAEAYQCGIQRIWVLNVGDLKPAEYQTELFMDMAWAGPENIPDRHLEHFLQREFGRKATEALAGIMERHYELAFIRRPEFLGGTRVYEGKREDWPDWQVIRDLPWSDEYILKRLDDYQAIEDQVEKIYQSILEDRRDAYFQLVKYPVQACAEMNKKIIYAQLARHGHGDGFWTKSDAAYDSIVSLTKVYNHGIHNDGKWLGMMDMAPRRLSVFGKITPGNSKSGYNVSRDSLNAQQSTLTPSLLWTPLPVGEVKVFALAAPAGKDTMAANSIEIRLLPHFPIKENGTLRVEARIDEGQWQTLHFEAAYHTEQWKQNVLQNYASARIGLAGNRTGRLSDVHTIQLRALDKGAVLMEMKFGN